MVKVSKDVFFGIICEKNLNVYYRAIGDYPYSGEFIFPNREIFGYKKPTENRIKYPNDPQYYNDNYYFVNEKYLTK